MHSVDITPEMKESVMEEQVMFNKKRGGLAKENVEKGFPAFPDYNTTDQNQCAYHGMAAAEGATISSVAKELRWDENIWDLSRGVPALK